MDLASATWGGELHPPHCTVSIISETDMECIYDNQTQAGAGIKADV